MNRREVISGVAAVTIAGVSNAQMGNVYTVTTPVEPTPEERKRQYAICKERGHTAGFDRNQVTFAITYPDDYVCFSRCKFCGTDYRFVTNLEENNTP